VSSYADSENGDDDDDGNDKNADADADANVQYWVVDNAYNSKGSQLLTETAMPS